METMLLHHQIRKAENDLWLYLAQKVKPWHPGKIKWWQPEGNEECICLSNRVCVNEPSKETTWTKPLASKSFCINYTEYQKATIKEESDTKEWMDWSDEPSVNGPFSNDLDNFNNITIQYIGTDASLAELHTELLINAILKPLDTFIFKYRTQDTSTAEEKVPTEYHKYLDIFKEEVECFPESRPWDHAIETKPRFEPRVFKSYNLTLEEHIQAMMNDTLKDEIEEGFCIIYIDDILMYAKNKEDLKHFTKCILKSLQKADLYLKPLKCKFCKMKIEYLGLIIEEGKMMMDPTKLNRICDWPIPKNVKQVRSFLGFRNFYWHFIWKFSKLTQSMNKLLQKDQPFFWDDTTQQAFDKMKKYFTKEPVLIMLDQTQPFQIECDALKYASGTVLMQLDVNGDWHPCAFISQTFSPTEQNYEIYDHELLSVIWALQEWQHYIQGSPHETTIYSDHKNLTYF